VADEPSMMEQFEEFLKAKEENARKQAAEEDEEVEIWDKDGRGARLKRSRAKPFLQSLGIDLDPPASSDSGDDDGKNTGKGDGKTGNSPGKKTQTAAQGNVARRYFTKSPGKLTWQFPKMPKLSTSF
jgi:hypothetical protein